MLIYNDIYPITPPEVKQPTMTKTMTQIILIKLNQYSASPQPLAPYRFMANIITKNIPDPILLLLIYIHGIFSQKKKNNNYKPNLEPLVPKTSSQAG